MTSNTISIIGFSGGLKCLCKIHFNILRGQFLYPECGQKHTILTPSLLYGRPPRPFIGEYFDFIPAQIWVGGAIASPISQIRRPCYVII